jgi:hypothetical protein
MATPFVSGPVHMFALIPGQSGMLYIGTGERAPKIRLLPEWDAVMNDLGGTKLPFDYLYEGEEALVGVTLTRWNQPVLDILRTRTNRAAPPGFTLPTDLGALMVAEGLTFNLYLFFPFATKAAMAAGGMPAGYHFHYAFLQGPDDLERGTGPNKDQTMFHCVRGFDITTGRMTLYDFSVGAMPALN